MRRELLDPYFVGSSKIHKLRPEIKLIAVLLVILSIVIMPRSFWRYYIAIGVVLILIALFSRIPFWHLLKRIIIIEPFIIGIAILSLLQPGGVEIFLIMLTKSTLCITSMVILAATTRFTDLIQAMWRFRLPHLLVTTLSLTYRYLFVLVDELSRMKRARRSRLFTKRKWLETQVLGSLIGHLFVRTSRRADRIYSAMCARGWKS
jgi:cobalt/nickel transport system permease protein